MVKPLDRCGCGHFRIEHGPFCVNGHEPNCDPNDENAERCSRNGFGACECRSFSESSWPNVIVKMTPLGRSMWRCEVAHGGDRPRAEWQVSMAALYSREPNTIWLCSEHARRDLGISLSTFRKLVEALDAD